jgi:CelD/BcsL family acetyltransferase involved in cellulose biosynthesis
VNAVALEPSAAAGAVTTGAVATGVVTDTAALAALRDGWHALNQTARTGCLFLGPEWLEPWWASFGAGVPGRALRVITVRDGATLIGLWPLFVEDIKAGGIAVQRLAFLGDGATGCDYLDILAAPGREQEVLEACLRQVGELDWDLLDLDGMWRESNTALQLAQRFPSEKPIAAGSAGLGGPASQVVRDGRIRYVCPNFALTGTYEQYLQGLGRRENLKRREKWLARQPGTSIECARTPQDAPAATERFFELHDARWAEDGGSDGLADDRFHTFHRAATQSLAERGWLRMYTLFAARRPVASVYGVVHRGKFLYYQSGYDPNWGNKSVGLVLLAKTVSDAYAEGLSEFDFLRGNEGYKAQWARSERWTIQLRVWRGARGRAAKAASEVSKLARDAVKSALPMNLIEGVRKARRLSRRGELDLASATSLFKSGREDA